jgi:peptidoglycan hydrolase-like protein with peptidoglycan-binding domain
MKFIRGGVGRGGQNFTEDVRLIQLLLNDYIARSTHYQIAVDGIADSRTIQAIEEFQRGAGLPATGVVEPTGPTLRFLVMGFITSLAGDLSNPQPAPQREYPSEAHISDALVYLARARGA